MKTFTKSIVFAVAMLLSVSVWAGNSENAPVSNNMQNAVTLQPANEVKDVQQTPCSIAVWSSCKGTANYYIPDTHGTPCETIALVVAAYLESFCQLQ